MDNVPSPNQTTPGITVSNATVTANTTGETITINRTGNDIEAIFATTFTASKDFTITVTGTIGAPTP